MITKVIKLDINKNLYEKIKAKQGDTKSRFLLFQLLDGSMPFNLENRSVRAYMLKPDSTEVFNDLIINNRNTGHCTLELTNQVLAVAGIVKIELMIIENDKKITSSIFELQVDKSINSENSIVSTNEFNALLNGLASLSEYDNYKEKAKKVPELEENIQELGSQLEHIAITLENYKHLITLNDYSIAINKAIQDISISGGGTLKLKGNIPINSPIKIKDNVTLCGNGQQNTVIQVNAEANCNAIECDWSTGYSIHDISIKNPKENTQGNCIVFGNELERKDTWGISIYNIFIIESPENGLLINPKFWVVNFHSLMIRNCKGSGILNKSSDNTYSNIFTFNCRWGIRNEASNNKVSNCKFTFCGMSTYLDSPTNFNPSASCGIYNKSCKRNVYENCESQDNYGYGFSFVDSYNISLSNMLADRCGTYATYVPGQDVGGYGFNFENCFNIQGDIMVDNYIDDKCQTGLKIENLCHDIQLNYLYKDQEGSDIISGKNIIVETPTIKKYKNMVLSKYPFVNSIENGFTNVNVTNATKTVEGKILNYKPIATSNQLSVASIPLVRDKTYKLIIDGVVKDDWSQVNLSVQANGTTIGTNSVTLGADGVLSWNMTFKNTTLDNITSSNIILSLSRATSRLLINNIQWYSIDEGFTDDMTKLFINQNKGIYGNSVIQFLNN